MPPHGRRRATFMLLLLCTICLLTSTASAASGVLGIDIGTEYIKAALVKPGIPLEIVLTKDSRRKEAAAIAFKPASTSASSSSAGIFPERAYGADAAALSARFPGDVYSNLKPLIGLKYSDETIANYEKMYPGIRLTENKERGTVSFKSETFSSDEEPFLVEELLAMQLQNIKLNAETFAGKGSIIKDVVFTIPAFYTVDEKRALETAAELAGLRILAMTTDGLSVGLNYATSRTFSSINEGAKPEYHLIYDMGAGSTTATILRFQGKTVKDVGRYNKTIQEVQVMGVGWDKSLGGDALNALILDDMVTKLTENTRMKTLGASAIHIKADGRTIAKMRKEAERMRQVLSANTETQSSFEGLYYDDVNFKYKISRTQLEKMATDFAARVKAPITRALGMAKLDIKDIESVILHGGAVRMPLVQKQLESIAKSADKVRTNVNSDEAAVFGAAFKAAGISPSFRVKEIRAIDAAVYAAGLLMTSEGKERDQKLFIPSSHVGLDKQVPFKSTRDFSFNLYQVMDGETTQNIPVSKVQTKNLTMSVKELTEKHGCSVADVRTQFSIRLSPVNGLPEVTRGSVSCEVDDSNKKGSVVDGVKGLFGFGSKKSDQAPLAEDLETGTTSSTEAETSTTTSSKAKPSDQKKADAKKLKKIEDASEEITKRIEVVYIEYSTEEAGLPKLSAVDIERIKIRMDDFDTSDRSRREREEALNTLEAYTYKARDLIEDEAFIGASTEAQRTEIESSFKLASEWLYGDGADSSKEDLQSRLKGLRVLVDPIQKRKDEALKRPDLVKSLRDTLDQTKAMLKVVKESTEKASMAAVEASAAAAKSSTEAAETAEAQTTSVPSSLDDDSNDLENETSTATSKSSTTTIPIPEMPTYTAEDLADLTTTFESVQTWLDEKVAEQDKLTAVDPAVLLSSDIATKSKQLNQVVMELLQRKMVYPPTSSKSSSKTKKTTKSKAMSTKKSKDKPATTVISGDALPTNISEDSTKPDIKDEL